MDFYIQYFFHALINSNYILLVYIIKIFFLYRIVLRIDDREVLTTTFEDETTIGSLNSLLLFGSLPDHLLKNFESHKNLATSESLIGCLSDFQYNYEFVNLFI